MASQYALNEPLPVARDLALTELATSLQQLENAAAQPSPRPRYAVWVYPRARGRSAVAPAALRPNASFALS